jgi:hypothetical protein
MIGHPVPPRRTYAGKKMLGVYVLPRRTQLWPRGVPPRRAHLEYHLGKDLIRVAQQPERQGKLEEPVRARPLIPTQPSPSG